MSGWCKTWTNVDNYRTLTHIATSFHDKKKACDQSFTVLCTHTNTCKIECETIVTIGFVSPVVVLRLCMCACVTASERERERRREREKEMLGVHRRTSALL